MKKDVFHKIADFLSDYIWESASWIPPILFSVVSIFHDSIGYIKSIIIVVGSIILSLVCSYKITRKKKSITLLEKEIEEKSSRVQELEATIEKSTGENYRLFEYSLSLLFKDFTLDDKCRISVYKKKGDRFVIMGRYSTNPELSKINRKHYTLNEGFIGKAYTEEVCFVDDLPEYSDGSRQKYYDAVTKKCNISKDVLKTISMKSRTYYCKALSDFRKVERKAVIVIESLDNAKFTKDGIQKLVREEEERLKYFIENFKFGPICDPENAKNEGF